MTVDRVPVSIDRSSDDRQVASGDRHPGKSKISELSVSSDDRHEPSVDRRQEVTVDRILVSTDTGYSA